MAGHYWGDLRPHTSAQHISGVQVDSWHKMDTWWRRVVYVAGHGERQMETWTAIKCLCMHVHTNSQTETDARHTHVHPLTHTALCGVPKQIKPSVELICVCCSALGHNPYRKHIAHSAASRPRNYSKHGGKKGNDFSVCCSRNIKTGS